MDKKNFIKNYINLCDEVIASNNDLKAKELEGLICSTFENLVKNIKGGLDFDVPDFYSTGDVHRADHIANIKKLKSKLELLYSQAESNDSNPQNNAGINISLDNSSNNSNVNKNSLKIDLKVLFKEARDKIESNDSLSEEEMNEVLEKINEIEEINNSNESKNKKWFKLRPVMNWLGTKGVSVATSVLGLVTALLNN
ncbi:hypothetical protein [Clostridium sp. DL1XJH146]